MKILMRLGGLLACILLSSCGGDANNTHPSAPGPAATSQALNVPMRPGDRITVRLSGVPDDGFFNEVIISPSGDITLPFLSQPFHAAGMSTAELAVQVTEAYKSQKIYTNPIVTILPEERFIIVEGDVRGPSNIVWRPNSTLMSTINQCGGFTDFADRRHVRVIRGQQVLHYDCLQAILTPGDDPPVFPEDQIFVPRTMF